MSSQALASLTATYTDSEGEEDMEDGQPTPDERAQQETSPGGGSEPSSARATESLPPSSSSAPVSPRRPARLVSYVDDALVSDEEPSSLVDNEDDHRRISMETDTDEYPLRSETEDGSTGATIPPEPLGKCPQDLQEKITGFYNRMMNEGMDMNKVIQDRKSFRNPSIYEKLIHFCNINELDTNYPPEIYDPLRWGKESYFEELAKVQKIEMDKREKERKEKMAKVDIVTGMAKRKDAADDDKSRKSKWDQPAPNSNSKPSIKPAGLVQPALTSNITGTKGTIISAFGALPKKPKI